ncbi:MAG: sulfite exporter TauE/SafE family protein [Planctomycetota bacterium]
MPADLPHLLLLTAAVAFGAFVQGAIGFAFVLLVTPLLIALGMSLPQTIAIGLVCVVVQTALSCWQARGELPWRDVGTVIGWRLLGLPLGIAALTKLAVSDPQIVKQVVGAALLLAVALLAVARPRPAEHVPIWATATAGTSSGFLAGLTGMGGPPLVLWLTLRDWPTRRTRGFLWLSFVLMIPVQFVLLAWQFPTDTRTGAIYGLAALPVVAGASFIGVRAGDRLPRERLRQVMLGVLVVLGLIHVTAPLW